MDVLEDSLLPKFGGILRIWLICCGAALLILVSELASVESAEPPAAPTTVKVAAVQCSSDLGDVAANTKKLTALVRSAASSGAKIVVLPEVALTGYLSQDGKTNWHVAGRPLEKEYVGKDPAGYAETVPGPSTRHFCKLAKELDIYVTVPLVEVDFQEGQDKPRYFNTACLVNRQGEMVLHYRKLKPWPHAEKSWATDGNRGTQTFDTEFGRVGIGICFDIYTIMEKYQDQQVWAMLYPTAWADNEHPAEWFFHKLPAKVKPFKLHLIDANWSVDEKQTWRGYGFSTIISNEGKVLASAKSLFGSEVVYADLPVAEKKSAADKKATKNVSCPKP
ncbi:MAG: carbon-nitrogen hydrolase family protein [Planctomycetes bacterium]|nr:carbon-nitrogen hydrolase family protein [Planctomycetota bacterium]